MTWDADTVRAARQATIDHVIAYLTDTDRDTVLAVLAKTDLSSVAKTDPDWLVQLLRIATPQEPFVFSKAWMYAQKVLYAAEVHDAAPAAPDVAALEGFARWVVSLDDPDGPGFDARRSVTMHQIITKAREALNLPED